jgi:2-amino-4-hydroxy-6-hydroxymethyldihydropteridine diphosphokinase
MARDAAVVIALGSNMAEASRSPDEILERAILTLGDNDITVTGRSRLWRSDAWPDPKGPEYRNAVVLVETKLTPASLMAALHRIERAFGRERGAPNAPRTLDLDLIAYGRRVEAGPPVLPHPRAAERRFVMGPLAELLPDWRHPVSGERAEVLADRASVGRDAGPLGDWPPIEAD